MGLRNYVLKNNEKPATHFIEVWSDGKLTNQEEDSERLFPINDLYDHLFSTKELADLYTIAIFKIRMK